MMKLLIERNADLNAQDRWGGTALWDAYREGHSFLCKLLVEKGGTTGKSALELGHEMCALAAAGDSKQLISLTQCGCQMSTPDFDSRTALHLGASEGQVEVVSSLLRCDTIDLNAVDRLQNTALDDALREGHKRIAQMLKLAGGAESTETRKLKAPVSKAEPITAPVLGSGAEASVLDTDKHDMAQQQGLDPAGKNAELRKARAKSTDAHKLLAEKEEEKRAVHTTGGQSQLRSTTADSLARAIAADKSQKGNALGSRAASVDSTTEDATRVLLLCTAAKENRPEQIDQLLSGEGRKLVNKGDYDGRTPLHVAAAEGNLSCIHKLLDTDADPNPTDRWGHTPLFDACNRKHTSCVTALTRFNAELRMDDVKLAALLCVEATMNRQEVVYTWLLAGCNANAADYDGRTALHAACSANALSTALTLLEFSADPNAKDRWGNTPQSDAALFDHENGRMVELLKTWTAPGSHTSNEASHNRASKVNRSAFWSGGGSDGDFDKYDLNHDGVLDPDELETKAAAQQPVAEEAGVKRVSDQPNQVPQSDEQQL